MPELPEVETIRRQLEPALVGRLITDAWGFDSPKFSRSTAATGARIVTLNRRGKYLIADLEMPSRAGQRHRRQQLVVHLGMTGRLAVCPVGITPPGAGNVHLRAWWTLEDGTYLGLWDARRFGRATVVAEGNYTELPTLAQLGPEPFSDDFTAQGLRGALSGRKALKTALMDQRVVAGVGNIYADEALWLSGIRPATRRLGIQRATALREAVVEVLQHALDDGGTTLRDYRDAGGSEGAHQNRLHCYGRAGLPCERCGRPLSRTVLDGRGTTWCQICQT